MTNKLSNKKILKNRLKRLKRPFIGNFLLMADISHKMLNVLGVRKLDIMIMLALINSHAITVYLHNIIHKNALKKLYVSGVINLDTW